MEKGSHNKRMAVLKAKFSSSITSADKNRAWQEITNIINDGNLVKKDVKEILNLPFPFFRAFYS
jgi:hypothetical protein